MTPNQDEFVSLGGPREAEGVVAQGDAVEVQAPPAEEWATPGSFIARQVAGVGYVNFVAERLEGARYAVFVILDDDPEDALDSVFEAEQLAMKEIPGISFDLRVRRPHPDWSPDDLLSSCIRHYKRP